MITQLIRVRNSKRPRHASGAFGYIIAKEISLNADQEMIIAWVDGRVEGEAQHHRAVAFSTPLVYITKEHEIH